MSGIIFQTCLHQAILHPAMKYESFHPGVFRILPVSLSLALWTVQKGMRTGL
jgi:hypothetical protein